MIDDYPNRIRAAAHQPVGWQPPQPHAAAHHPVGWQPPQPPAAAYHPVHWQPPQPPAAYQPAGWQAIQPHSTAYPPAITPAPSVPTPAHQGHATRPKHHVDTILATVLAVLVAAAGLLTAASSTSPDGHWGSVAAVRWVETELGSLLRLEGTASGEIVAAAIDTPTTNL